VQAAQRQQPVLKGPPPIGDGKLAAFTCGHAYSHAYLLDELLPRLQRRLTDLNLSHGRAVQILVADYHQQLISSACPICVYNELAKDKTTEERWET